VGRDDGQAGGRHAAGGPPMLRADGGGCLRRGVDHNNALQQGGVQLLRVQVPAHALRRADAVLAHLCELPPAPARSTRPARPMPTQPAALLARAADLLVWRQVFILKTAFPAQYGFPGPTVAMSRKLWPMAMGWWVYGISGVIALKYLNVPMFSSFRRFTTIIVMYGEYRLYGTRAYSPPPSLSFPPFPPPLLRPPPVVSIEKPHSARRQHACAARAHTHTVLARAQCLTSRMRAQAPRRTRETPSSSCRPAQP
jgi:hypothetical protein